MARKKREEGGGGGNAPWLNTFADLMNLLLCFFVLLFAMSDVDSEKFEQISISMANSIGVFEAGGSSIGTGQLIAAGMSQLTNLSEYFNTMGKTSEGDSDPTDSPANQSENTPQENKGDKEIGIDEAMEKVQEERVVATSEMYDEISELADQNRLGDYMELSIDSQYQYVQITLKGSVLFDSGEADVKEVAEPILLKVGEILKQFEDYGLEITGHTDNIPMSSSTFKDNNWLSSARALNAAEFLIDNCDIDPARLKYSGRGEYEPIASNATADGRAKNRRIEIKIYNEYSSR